MNIQERCSRYQAIESYRERPLIVYATSTRHMINARMAGDAVREFIDQIDAIPDGNKVDVLLHSSGGDPLAAWKLMSVLRERFKQVVVLVPNMAFSAATLFALGADEIVMHPHASLGPIDPQIQARQPDGNHRLFSYEDVGAFLRFLSEDVGVTEQAYLSAIIDRLFHAADPLVIGGSKRASDLSTDIGERMLLVHMKGSERAAVRKIAEDLNKGSFAHGDAVSRSRAKELRLKVASPDPELERLIWQAYLGIEDYMQLRRPFNPLELYLANPDAARTLMPPPAFRFPPDAPKQLVDNVLNAWAGQALAAAQAGGIEVPFTLIHALVESPRCACEMKSTGKVFASRNPDGNIRVTVTDTTAGWQPVAVAAATA